MEYKKAFTNGAVNRPTSHQDESCKFCAGVRCSNYNSHGRRIEKDCDICGHNPAVAKERLKEYCEKRGITIPKGK